MVTSGLDPTRHNSRFYQDQADRSLRSAREVVPSIPELTRGSRGVDVGCGVGTWLRCYEELGVTDCLGMDGSWVAPSRLLIDPNKFRCANLTEPPTLDRRFDLAQSIEVAEHLEETYAPRFVGFLCSLSNVVIFSAAIPNQGGTHHVNERWPGWWRELFDTQDYALYDVFRPRFWSNESLDWWYAQNLFLYIKRGSSPHVRDRLEVPEGFRYPERMVHPGRIDPSRDPPPGLRGALRAIPAAVARKARSWML
jgi:SAM-dependent methyltransferase